MRVLILTILVLNFSLAEDIQVSHPSLSISWPASLPGCQDYTMLIKPNSFTVTYDFSDYAYRFAKISKSITREKALNKYESRYDVVKNPSNAKVLFNSHIKNTRHLHFHGNMGGEVYQVIGETDKYYYVGVLFGSDPFSGKDNYLQRKVIDDFLDFYEANR